jgi:Helix-turn-helix domain
MCREIASPYLTTNEAAAFLRIKPRTLANMRHNEMGPDHRKHGGRVVYAVDDLTAWSNSTRRRRRGK